MLAFEAIAERKIREAIERGEFADLPGAGRPLEFDDDPLVPEDLRLAHRILKNAGFVPPELEAQKEIRDLEQLIRGMGIGAERSRAISKLQLLNSRLARTRRGSMDLRLEAAYYDKLVERLSGE
jgi:DnaJ homologue, subfamily C, member 28, conserved domain